MLVHVEMQILFLQIGDIKDSLRKIISYNNPKYKELIVKQEKTNFQKFVVNVTFIEVFMRRLHLPGI